VDVGKKIFFQKCLGRDGLGTTFGAPSRGCAIGLARDALGEIVQQDALEKWIVKWVMCEIVRVRGARLRQSVAITHVVAGSRVRQGREFDIVNSCDGSKRKPPERENLVAGARRN
jgi:hypothetical protein